MMSQPNEQPFVPRIDTKLRKHIVTIPEEIERASGFTLWGRRIRSLIFSTDIAIIRNCNADAVLAVYPFTPQPIISNAIISRSSLPVFCGVGGGTTTGHRVAMLAQDAEALGAMGVVVTAPTTNVVIRMMHDVIDIPIIITVLNEKTDIQARLDAGAIILNVSAAAKTPEVVAHIRKQFPQVPIIATGGPTNESIRRTIDAGANAISFTPPTAMELFHGLMSHYRQEAIRAEDLPIIEE